MNTPSLLAVTLLATAPAAQLGSAIYEVTFETTWSGATHPIAFPSNPHFSPLVGATHDANTMFWRVGRTASPGIESMAEVGGTSALRAEVNAAIGTGGADSVLLGNGLGTSPSSVTLRFSIRAEYPRITLVSMLAPSPDWFVGVDSLLLVSNNRWINRLTVPLHVWDAGSDSGTSYNSPNQNTVPKEPIGNITTASGPFAGRPEPVGTFVFRRLASTMVYGCNNPKGSLTVTSGVPLLNSRIAFSLDDPGRTMTQPTFTTLVIAGRAELGFPCGRSIPGWGLTAPGTPGDYLIRNEIVAIAGDNWTGNPVTYGIDVPNQTGLIGVRLFAQGALLDLSPRVGLTDAVEFRIGQ